MDKQREMFEAWYGRHCKSMVGAWFVRDLDNSDEYWMPHTQTAWDAWQAAIAAQQGGTIAMPEPGTTEYGSWINKAKDKTDQCFASHGEDRFKWLCQFEQHLRKSANGGKK